MTTPRFKTLTLEEMTEAQRSAAEQILAGPRKGMRGPFNALLRSPGLADHVQRVGEYVRFHNSLAAPLRELGIIITARHWNAQFEWYAHRRLALEAGLSPAICDAIAAGRRPEGMSPDETVVHDFCSELLATTEVSDATFAAMRDRFGENGVMDLIGTVGYYSFVSLVLNVDRHPLPEGVEPLPALRK
jgi:4-carboxymuconolactone decarboxylase